MLIIEIDFPLFYGWINRELVASGKRQKHINAFGGEDRFWLAGPEPDMHRQTTATLWAITEHVYMYVENDVQVDQQAIESAEDAS